MSWWNVCSSFAAIWCMSISETLTFPGLWVFLKHCLRVWPTFPMECTWPGLSKTKPLFWNKHQLSLPCEYFCHMSCARLLFGVGWFLKHVACPILCILALPYTVLFLLYDVCPLLVISALLCVVWFYLMWLNVFALLCVWWFSKALWWNAHQLSGQPST